MAWFRRFAKGQSSLDKRECEKGLFNASPAEPIQLRQSLKPTDDFCLAKDADRLIPFLPGFEKKQCRNAANSKFLGDERGLVHIDLGHGKFPRVFPGDFFDHRCEHTAWRAPWCPKINQQRF